VVKRALSRGYLGLILVLIAFSFNSIRSMSKWGGFSFRWYTELFQNDTIMSALWVTVSVAVIAAIVATALGTLAAIGIHGYRRRTQNLVLNVTYLPILNPDIVTGLSLMLLFLFVGLPRGYFTLVLAHITFNIPYVILTVLPKLRQMDSNLYEAALDLGATPGYAMRKVILPEIMPGIVTGALLALTLSLDDFVISLFTQTGTSNISILVYSMARRSINPQINALSTLLFVAVLALLFIVNWRASKDDIAKETHR